MVARTVPNIAFYVKRPFRVSLLQNYRGADNSLNLPVRKQANISVRMAWNSFGVLPYRKKENLMTTRVSMLLKSCASLISFRGTYIPGRAKDLSLPRYYTIEWESDGNICVC